MNPSPPVRLALQESLPPWGVGVLESHHADQFYMEWRVHDFHKMIYAARGEGSLLLSKNSYSFAAGDLIWVPANRRNRLVDNKGAPSSLYVLCMAPSLLAFDRSLARQIPAGCIKGQLHFANQANRLIKRMLYHQRSGAPHASISMLADGLTLLRMAIEAAQPTSVEAGKRPSADLEMAEYVRRLNATFFESTSLDEAAATMRISRRSFTQRFKKFTGVSWVNYRQQRAIEHACWLLLETQATIASIAFECGYSDLSSFYRSFKKHRGVAPAEWRRDAQAAKR